MNKQLFQICSSAGSGKTYRLTSDYLAILNRAYNKNTARGGPCRVHRNFGGTQPDEILAITFTNAAATEMRSRVIERLKETVFGRQKDVDMSQEAAEKWLNLLLGDLTLLNIRTIDSLLHMIVRSSALELGLNPDFETSFNIEDVFEPWLDELFDLAKTDQELRQDIAAAFRACVATGTFKGFLSKSNFHKQLYKVVANTLLGKFAGLSTQGEVSDKINRLTENVIEAARIFAKVSKEEKLKFKQVPLDILEKQANGLLSEKSSAYMFKEDISPLLLKTSPPANLAQAAHLDWSQACAEYYKAIQQLRKSIQLLAFVKIARRLAKKFDNEKRILKNLPEFFIPSFAAKALDDGMAVSEAICRLGTRLSYFLVDEFQDTSYEQWRVLRTLAIEALATGGSLTWAGDVKQSIYGWRGGDSELFNAIGADPALTAIAGFETDKLEFNRRSLPAIVRHNNSLFSGLSSPAAVGEILRDMLFSSLPENVKNIWADKIAVAYKDVIQQILPPKSGEEGIVWQILADGSSSAEARENILAGVVGLLQNHLAKNHAWADILILCRANDDCKATAKTLLDHKIPVITENSLLLAEHPLISQATAFIQFLASPEDDIAFWTLLTGSICQKHPAWRNASPEELADWACESAQRPLSQAFRHDYPELWNRFFGPFLASDALLSPYDAVAEWFGRLSVQERFGEDLTFLRRFLEILHAAEQKGNSSCVSFLEYWRKDGMAEKAPMPENADAVTIMTIHKAKGLQKQVVIVPYTNFEISPSNEIGVCDISGLSIPISLNGKSGREAEYYNDKCKQALEALNLLYVAFTRAERELYYFLTPNIKRQSPTAKALKQLMRDDLNGRSLTVEDIASMHAPSPLLERSEAQMPQPALAEMKDDWRPLGWMPRLKIHRAHPAAPYLTAAERGNFAHACLERINFNLPADLAAETAFNDALHAMRYNIPDNERNNILKALQWICRLPIAKQFSKQIRKEQSLVTKNGKVLRPDLLIMDKRHPLVIDYKTGEPDPRHVHQVREYLQCLDESAQFPNSSAGLLIYMDKRAFQLLNSNETRPLSKCWPL